MNTSQYSSMKEKHRKEMDDLDKAAAKHLVKLGVEKNWKETLRQMRNRRRKRERTT